jgi:type I restriction enzyme S subunit
MTIENKAPEIRYQGFSCGWQNKEIGSILAETKRSVELLDNELYQLVTVKRRNEGVVPRATLKGKDILVKNYYGVKAGDYLISKRQVVHGANGIVPDSLDNAVVSNEYLVLTDSDEITAKFWTVISKRPELHKLFFISSYGVDIEKLVFDVSDWKSRAITIPSVAEQNAITDYFQKLDSLINQHQQKHDKLSNIKKAMLEKMFPKQGETIPEIRFKGFSGEWEEKALGAVSRIKTGSSNREDSGLDGEYTFFDRSEDIRTSDIFLFDCEAVIVAGEGSDFIPKYFVGKFDLHQRTYAIMEFDDCDGKYLFYYIHLFRKHFSDQAVGSTVKSLRLPMFEGMPLKVPEKTEQEKIGNYFYKLDTLINQHQQQINKLNHIKQACLSKMFV